jgi:hypothetical protein
MKLHSNPLECNLNAMAIEWYHKNGQGIPKSRSKRLSPPYTAVRCKWPFIFRWDSGKPLLRIQHCTYLSKFFKMRDSKSWDSFWFPGFAGFISK